MKKIENLIQYSLLFLIVSIISSRTLFAEDENKNVSYNYSLLNESYEIESIKINGAVFTDHQYIFSLLFVKPGQRILSNMDPRISQSISNIIRQDLASDVTICLQPINDDKAILLVEISEYPRLKSIKVNGLDESSGNNLMNLIKFVESRPISRSYLSSIKSIVAGYLQKEGFAAASFKIYQNPSSSGDPNVELIIEIKNAHEIVIGDYIFLGINDEKLKEEIILSIQHNKPKSRFTILKKIFSYIFTKDFYSTKNPVFSYFNPQNLKNFYNTNAIFLSSNFDKDKFSYDRKAMLDTLHSKGYINSRINKIRYISDASKEYCSIVLDIDKGDIFTINNVVWNGLNLYDPALIQKLLKIEKGKIYNMPAIKKALTDIMSNSSLASLYYNKGYLSYYASLVESGINFESKTIDLTIDVHEDEIYKLNKIIIEGNTMTHDNIILREIVTLPGQKFSGDYLKMSYNHLAMLQLFEPAIDIKPIPNPITKTFDMLYVVKEKPQLGFNLAGSLSRKTPTVQLSFNTNNVSIANLFKGRLPLGENQTFGIELSLSKDELKLSNLFNIPQISESFPMNLQYRIGFGTSKVYRKMKDDEEEDFQDEGDRENITSDETISFDDYIAKRKYIGKSKFFSSSISLGKYIKGLYRTKLSGEVSYSYNSYLANCSIVGNDDRIKGTLHDLHFSAVIEKNTHNNPIFPTEGLDSCFRISSTIPYSLLGNSIELEERPDIDEFKFKEFITYHYDFNYNYSAFSKLVITPQFFVGGVAGFGKSIGPFHRFSLGGTDSNSLLRIVSPDHVRLRGYEDGILTPKLDEYNYSGGVFATKISLEAKYPVIESHIFHASIFSFIDAGNCWNEYKKINIFNMYRSIGFGLRVYVGLILNAHVEFSLGYPLKLHGDSVASFTPHIAFGLGR